MRILVVTGASGGHIFPALSFLDTLKAQHRETETLLVIPSRSLKISMLAKGIKVKYLAFATIALSLSLQNFIGVFKFLKGSLESLFLLLEFRPDIVVGFGGLGSLPLVLAAWIFRIKTLIHEQNVIPGRANRLLARFADRIAISFPETKDYLKISENRIALTGNPVRQELQRVDRFKALNFFGFDADKVTILVMGGSRGSHRINMSFSKAISTMSYASNLQVIHLTGLRDYSLLAESYRGLNIKIKLFNFLEEMQYAYSICDLVISRAGATTISELIEFCLPAILIPYPFAYKHQFSNAKVLERIGAAAIIRDDDLDDNTLKKTVDKLINNPEKIKAMQANYNRLQRLKSNELLAEQALSLLLTSSKPASEAASDAGLEEVI